MKAFVITIKGHKGSEEYAQRCIDSGKTWGWDIQRFDAITPNHDLPTLCDHAGIDPTRFVEKYSRTPNCIAAFLSHYSLWDACFNNNEGAYAIFEHDAIVTGPMPTAPTYVGNIGEPSYGKFKTPATFGWGNLVSKPYFPGAHAYIVTPTGAKLLCETAKTQAMPTDVYLNVVRFEWLQEYYPYVAKADDSFSTIQNVTGTLAKHNYEKGIEISDI
jgi:GR25 family glycosyltransferase involved in LPS biosynthesis